MHILVKALTTLATAAPNAGDRYDDDCDDDCDDNWYSDCDRYRARYR